MELEEALGALNKGAPVIPFPGVRMIGKTSLLKTALGLTKNPWICIDSRRLDEEGSSRD